MDRGKRLARIAGILYVIVAVCGGFSELYVRASVDVEGGAAAIAGQITASEKLIRIGALTDLVAIAGTIGVGIILYGLLEHASRSAAVMMLSFNAIAVAVLTANMVNHLGALQAATSGSDGLAALFLDLHGYGYLVAGVFFGLWLLPLGRLLIRSGSAPRWLGLLLMVGAFGYVADVAANTLFAKPGEMLVPVLTIPSVVAELSLIAWLLFKGLDVPPRAADARALPDPVPAAA